MTIYTEIQKPGDSLYNCTCIGCQFEFLHCHNMHQTADNNRMQAYTLTTKAVRDNMHVDDLLKCLDTTSDGPKIYRNMKHLYADNGFLITKWCSNKKEIILDVTRLCPCGMPA